MAKEPNTQCGATIDIIGMYGQGTYHCSLMIHSGQHEDLVRKFVWGQMIGDDEYTTKRREQIQAAKDKRRFSARMIRKLRNG
ncbi:hypothetical protein EVC23_002 [Rhizobium phage RHph_N3_8]|uniref:hypothetical protein n=1 Tax=Rhizobium phage RHph_N3_8 TaxID=2509748 RepID=UPI001AF3192B|nr:hypothetical protein QEJ65_gp02 [Rhizobium phage RHph_N3_8]QIG76001.1 hypothetical protein EVC23_002 [Rhizobium phage RHph_N3_8]